MSDQIAFWRRTPPALFPVCLGILGLGLAWRQIGSDAVSQVIIALGVMIFGATFLCYAAKVIRRPSVLAEEMQLPPARGAVSAGSMCWMLVAAILSPFAPSYAVFFCFLGLALHAFYFAFVIAALRRSEAGLSQLMPPMLLPFVGYIVAAISGAELGFTSLSKFLIYLSAPFIFFILAMSVRNVMAGRAALPDRVGFYIFLAPFSIYGIAAANLWSAPVFSALVWLSILCLVLILPFLRWMLSGGWTPAWGALTFPSSAFAGLMALAHKAGVVPELVAWAALLIASMIVTYIAVRTYAFWFQGKLAIATKAAVA